MDMGEKTGSVKLQFEPLGVEKIPIPAYAAVTSISMTSAIATMRSFIRCLSSSQAICVTTSPSKESAHR
jgi:hypothetical protein